MFKIFFFVSCKKKMKKIHFFSLKKFRIIIRTLSSAYSASWNARFNRSLFLFLRAMAVRRDLLPRNVIYDDEDNEDDLRKDD